MFARPHRSLFLFGLLASVNSACAENWPAWRGPRGDGTSSEMPVPVHWSAASNVVWKTEIPGHGHASPIVWGNRVFTVTALLDRQDRVLLCLDRKTGQFLWQKTVVRSPLEKKHSLNSYASSTPATDGDAPRLTDRETEILRLVAKGLSYRQIAERLVVSHRTVQNHVQNTLNKLQLHNRVELVRYAIEQGLDGEA